MKQPEGSAARRLPVLPCHPRRRGPGRRRPHPVRRGHRLQGPEGHRHQAGGGVLISGIGGLGHIAVQYAVAMGLRVAAVDVEDSKLELARTHGAEVTVNARTSADPAAEIKAATGGVHGALVTAVNAHAFPQAVGALRRGGTVSLVGLPPEQFPLDIFTTVLFGLTVRGSIVGTRKDMAEALDFFARGKVSPTYTVRPMDEINEIFTEMEQGRIDGRVVMSMAG